MDQTTDAALNNLISEALLLHARTLLEFFYGSGRKHKDGIYADHFTLTPEEWSAYLGGDDEVVGGVKVRAMQARLHQRLAHLSHTRVRGFPGSWKVAELAVSLQREFMHFLHRLPEQRRSLFEQATVMDDVCTYIHWPNIDCWLESKQDSSS